MQRSNSPRRLRNCRNRFARTDNLHGWLRSACIDLNISNIRIIKKIERLAVQVGELLKPFEADVTNNVVRSLCVLAWSFYSRVDAPTIEFLKTRRNHQRLQRLFGAEEDIRFTDEEVGWGVILDSYGFTNCDDLDLALLDGIQRGFFDEEKVLREAAKYQENAELFGVMLHWRRHGNPSTNPSATMLMRLSPRCLMDR